jgi:WD40 repeat protein
MNATPSFFSKPQFKALNKLRANLSQKTRTRQSTQHTTLIQKLHASITLSRPSLSSDTVVTLPSPLPQASVSTVDSTLDEQRNWSIKFNDKSRKGFCIEIAHELCHEARTFSVKFSRDGKYLAVGCHNGTAYIYDVQTGTLTQ